MFFDIVMAIYFFIYYNIIYIKILLCKAAAFQNRLHYQNKPRTVFLNQFIAILHSA